MKDKRTIISNCYVLASRTARVIVDELKDSSVILALRLSPMNASCINFAWTGFITDARKSIVSMIS